MGNQKGAVTSADCSEEEWQARIDLAICYQICDQMDMNEGIDNHLTVLVPGTDDLFLCIAYGTLWSEVTPGNLLTINSGGEIVRGEGCYDDTAFFIHSTIHCRRPKDAAVVFHTHMPWAASITCLEDPTLVLLHQDSLRFYGDLTYDTAYNGLALNEDEGTRLANVLGDKRVAMLSNHGVIVVGKSVALAFDALYFLEKACKLQVLAMSMNKPIRLIDEKVAEDFGKKLNPEYRGRLHFEARKRYFLKHADEDFL